jgi:hypothetical protein
MDVDCGSRYVVNVDEVYVVDKAMWALKIILVGQLRLADTDILMYPIIILQQESFDITRYTFVTNTYAQHTN